jgi:hypothetical protein
MDKDVARALESLTASLKDKLYKNDPWPLCRKQIQSDVAVLIKFCSNAFSDMALPKSIALVTGFSWINLKEALEMARNNAQENTVQKKT